MSSDDIETDTAEKRRQFGTRFLLDKKNVFEHNAWDNVVWDEVQEAAAKSKVQENSDILLTSEEIGKLDEEAADHWDAFYGIHDNKFFKDRNWLFTEFPELAHSSALSQENRDGPTSSSETVEDLISATVESSKVNIEDNDRKAKSFSEHESKRTQVANEELVSPDNEAVKLSDVSSTPSDGNSSETFPGQKSRFRIFEVGCGVGNTIFPILKTNNAEDLFVYGCDFSSRAIEIVRESSDYEIKRCRAFVCDITCDDWNTPFPEETLDVIVCIFVLSAIHPDKFQHVVNKMASYLRPGGLILFRDYGRYDLAQLRFKRGRCLSENFYARGDGTRCYFFTQEEVRQFMTTAGLEEVQNLVDRRLQVNRGKRLTMYRVWVQAKYKKPLSGANS